MSVVCYSYTLAEILSGSVVRRIADTDLLFKPGQRVDIEPC